MLTHVSYSYVPFRKAEHLFMERWVFWTKFQTDWSSNSSNCSIPQTYAIPQPIIPLSSFSATISIQILLCTPSYPQHSTTIIKRRRARISIEMWWRLCPALARSSFCSCWPHSICALWPAEIIFASSNEVILFRKNDCTWWWDLQPRFDRLSALVLG